ncbi:MAG: hypothetical protein NZZ41_00215 [Candidatus Dojkabacteria bacterium]|nr:hypothetical protein [Candidatus Dojkabacteria bacterium]
MNGFQKIEKIIIENFKEVILKENLPFVKKEKNRLLINNYIILSINDHYYKRYNIYKKNVIVFKNIYHPLLALIIVENIEKNNKQNIITKILEINKDYGSILYDIINNNRLIKLEKNKIDCSNEKIEILETKKIFYLDKQNKIIQEIKKIYNENSITKINLDYF